ncbi:hypothetical protein Clacol_001603 [Clathrus columnatus]|uniref:glutamine--tRNA ligase n=1 Tax=Clathrus columnatus TaxID=1419009 RepID=A0AAV5A470_9AGAM|nr:hypothetical protein Clacol_001603 [Clathrus columnatus]
MTSKSKFDIKDPNVQSLLSLFQAIGLSSTKATETVRNQKSASSLKDLIDRSDLTSAGLGEKQSNFVLQVALQGSKLGTVQQDYIVKYIVAGKLKSSDQVSAAVTYLEKHPLPVGENDFESECGVGVIVTVEQINAIIGEYVLKGSVRGWADVGSVLSGVKNLPTLRWANTLDVKNSVERIMTEAFGPKNQPKGKTEKQPTATPGCSNVSDKPGNNSEQKQFFSQGFLGNLYRPGENPQIRPDLREKHLAATGGQVWTRFPPEPNGFLHIGHSKAIYINFGYASYHKGQCYLRYDDTNPEAEEAQYFDSILDIVRWLGFEPWKITYSSDYFQQLYELAVELIRRDKGYICHCTAEEIKANRGEKEGVARKPCTHRTRPVEESLVEFKKMKEGLYQKGEAVLRMKQDLDDGNPQMWDLIAYRVVNAAHHRTGSTWKIYPTYDFTHCLVDSIENISHSLCTTEFILSRVSYEWLCDAVEVYKPRQSEYGRLNMQGTITSKRKILSLVRDGYVTGWDDPRLFTLVALRRRGIPPGAILSFVESLGVSTADAVVETVRFDQSVRQYLENTVPRLLVVLRPLKVTLTNVPDGFVMFIDKQLHPKRSEIGSVSIPFTKTIYIDKEDFRIQDSNDYFRLAPGKTVGLFQAPYPITCISYKVDQATGAIIELLCRLEDGKDGLPPKKPKAFIQWVAEHAPSGSPVKIDEVRIFHQLFKSDNPASLPNYKEDLNPDSLEVVEGAFIEVGVWSVAKKAWADANVLNETAEKKDENSRPVFGKEIVRFQGLRVAYFALERDSVVTCLDDPKLKEGKYPGDRLILNRIVSLKEDAGKSAS